MADGDGDETRNFSNLMRILEDPPLLELFRMVLVRQSLDKHLEVWCCLQAEIVEHLMSVGNGDLTPRDQRASSTALYKFLFRKGGPARHGFDEMRDTLRALRLRVKKEGFLSNKQYVEGLQRVQVTYIQHDLFPAVKNFVNSCATPNAQVLMPLSHTMSVLVRDDGSARLEAGTVKEILHWLLLDPDSIDSFDWLYFLMSYRKAIGSRGLYDLIIDVKTHGLSVYDNWLPEEGISGETVKMHCSLMLLIWRATTPELDDFEAGGTMSEEVEVLAQQWAHLGSASAELNVYEQTILAKLRSLAACEKLKTAEIRLCTAHSTEYNNARNQNVCLRAMPRVPGEQMLDIHRNSPGAVAHQLTLVDQLQFSSVPFDQLMVYAGLADHQSKSAASSPMSPRRDPDKLFSDIEQQWDRLVWTIITHIAASTQRDAALEWWIRVGLVLESINNYQSLMSVSSALNHYLITGLKMHWKDVNADLRENVSRWESLFSHLNNYSEYRAEMNRLCGEVIPGMFGMIPPKNESDKNNFTPTRVNSTRDSARGMSIPLVATPILQRDLTLAKEMPTHIGDGLNLSKLLVLGKAVLQFNIGRLAHGLGKIKESTHLIRMLLAIPWTNNEDILYEHVHKELLVRRSSLFHTGKSHIDVVTTTENPIYGNRRLIKQRQFATSKTSVGSVEDLLAVVNTAPSHSEGDTSSEEPRLGTALPLNHFYKRLKN